MTVAGSNGEQASWLSAPGIAPTVRDAFRQVPPADFFSRRPDGSPVMQTTSPELIARMLSGLRLAPGMRVLEIGTGSGYNAALLGALVGPAGTVVSVEIDPAVAANARRRLDEAGTDNVKIITGDGAAGHAPVAPYDRIIATCKAPNGRVPCAWAEQLAPGGLLAVPLDIHGVPETTVVVYFRKIAPGRMESVCVHRAGFIPMAARADEVTPQPWKRADLVLWTDPAADLPALWLHAPGAAAAGQPDTKTRLLRCLLGSPQPAPLPGPPCSSSRAFWAFVAVATTENVEEKAALLAVRRGRGDEDESLPPAGFGFASGDFRGAAVLPAGATLALSAFGEGGPAREATNRLLACYAEWCARGQPDVDDGRLSAAATAPDPNNPAGPDWPCRFFYTPTEKGTPS